MNPKCDAKKCSREITLNLHYILTTSKDKLTSTNYFCCHDCLIEWLTELNQKND